MAKAYSPGLAVTDNIVLRKDRILPLKGEVKVKKGDKVKAEDVVAVTMLPGKVVPINLANKLGTTPQLLKQFLKVQPGDFIKKDQVLAETKGFLGMFKSIVKSPTDGEVESISAHTGQMLLREPRIPVEVKAFIDSVVVDVVPEEGVIVENRSAYIQGIFGLAGETTGNIELLVSDPNEELKADKITDAHKGKIIVSGSMISLDAINKAAKCGVNAIITGGIDDQDLKEMLGYDIGVAITGHEKIGTTIVVTEGFGRIKMADKTFGLLKQFNGKKASVHGKTQIRAGVMRPEIIIPIEFDQKDLGAEEAKMPTLEIGSMIRVIRQPNFGHIGEITSIPEELYKVDSETLVRILKAKLDTGEEVVIPRANVEIISE